MPGLDLLLFAIVAIIAFSIFFSISAWIYLGRIASKTNLLEQELEKKSLEFDALKKERLNDLQSSSGASVIESNEPLIETVQPATSLHDAIQIFRNVRGTFEHSEQTFDAHSNENPILQPELSQSYSTSTIEIRSQTNTIQQPENIYSVNQSVSLPPAAGSLEKEPASPAKSYRSISKPVAKTFTLSLYSEITKDADFQTLWKKITTILQNHPAPSLAIDLSYINYLYEKEMEYLDKINYLIRNQGGSLTLINCEQELLALLNRKQHLGSIVTL